MPDPIYQSGNQFSDDPAKLPGSPIKTLSNTQSYQGPNPPAPSANPSSYEGGHIPTPNPNRTMGRSYPRSTASLAL
jgi:hypothetical protein